MSLVDLFLTLKEGRGRGNFGHKGRPGHRGGSAPSSTSLSSFNLKWGEGQAYHLTKNSNIDSKQFQSLTSGSITAIYNVKTKEWTISPTHTHAEIMADALGDKYIYDEDWKHTVKAMITDNKVVLYDLSQDIGTIAESPRQEKTISSRLEKNLAAAVDNLFKIDSKDVEYSYEPWEFV